jgi:DHA1 family bicyclomycin/chloramphenicol resistance-like MFS transporter
MSPDRTHDKSPLRRRVHPESLGVVALLTLAVALGPLATDLYLPSLPAIGQHFAVDVAATQLTLSVFLVGFAVSQLVYGALSDRFGRRPVMLAGFVVFLAASVLCALATSLDQLILGRFLQALGVCAGPVLGRAVVRDVFGPARAAKVLSYMAAAMALGPAVGPIIGGLLEVWIGWRASFWALAAVCAVLLLGVGLALPETNRHKDPTATQPHRMLRNFGTLLSHRGYLGYALIVASAYSGIFAFISGSSFLLIEVAGLSPETYGFCFAAAVLGYMVGTLISGRFGQRLGQERTLALGTLVAVLSGATGLGLALAGIDGVAAVVAPVGGYLLGCGLMLPNALAGALRHYPRMAGAASALMGFLQMGVAAAVGIGVGQLHDGSAVPMAGAIAGAALACLLSLLLLVRPGNRHDAAHRAGPEH